MSSLTSSIFGILKDSLDDEEYSSQSKKMDDLEEYLLQFAHEFDCDEFVEKDDGKNVLKDAQYEKMTMPILEEYGECEAFDTLANKLAWRDFKRDHSQEEIEKMAKKNGGYFGVALHPYEKKYWDEFEKNGYERVEIVAGDVVKKLNLN
jgi:hypothetical protein